MRFGFQVLAKINFVLILPDIHVKVYRRILFSGQFCTKPYCIWNTMKFPKYRLCRYRKVKEWTQKLGSELCRRRMSHFGWANQNKSDGSRNKSANMQIENFATRLKTVRVRVRSSSKVPWPLNSSRYKTGSNELGLTEEFFNLHFT